MPPIVHKIDPDYDTVIVLTHPCKNFAPWDPAGKIPKPEEPQPRQECTDGDGLLIFHGEPVEEPEEEVIHYHLSSQHLILASPWFKRALAQDKWIESGGDKGDGRFHISAEDWDPGAFLILLNIFHLRTRKVPWTVSLETLAKIGVLVDSYDCAEELDLKWCRVLQSVITSVHLLLFKYRSCDSTCPQVAQYSFVCDSILYGALTKELAAVGLLSPRPEVQFNGRSFGGTACDINNMKSPTWRQDQKDSFGTHLQLGCSLSNAARTIVFNAALTIMILEIRVKRGRKVATRAERTVAKTKKKKRVYADLFKHSLKAAGT
ncbi:hypothetical protein K458DRAFT_382247 [Lentithecium fluviatile CBS 122367]|uniref:BTB domain-containing protein n=1 Tax=Lentithecium fluviatile CBS 122367 TaxID=1168545 RepID=A0A6G1JKB7_9PLEO|nr:hypothetical protein K458DRAFT_382247 [Lentithecium fluviatile CBS 122367]